MTRVVSAPHKYIYIYIQRPAASTLRLSAISDVTIRNPVMGTAAHTTWV